MSSRLIAPNPGEISLQTRMISSGSLLSMQIGNASRSAKRFISSALPSMTGNPATAPISPSPNTAVPSVTTATVLPLPV